MAGLAVIAKVVIEVSLLIVCYRPAYGLGMACAILCGEAI